MHLILAGYRADDLVRAIEFCERHIAPQAGERRVLVINHPDLVEGFTRSAEGWEVVAGSNVLGEFSAWQEGLDHLDRPDAAVMFANDTMNTHRHFTGFRTAALLKTTKAARGSTLVGFRDSIEGPVQAVAGLPLDGWVSTYCFYMTADALRRVNYRIVDPEAVEACVPGGHQEPGFFAQLSPELEAHLRRWLFGGWWYGGGPLTPQNRERLTRKAQAIISEKVLSARCQQADIKMVDPFDEFRALWQADRIYRKVFQVLGRKSH